MDDQRLSELFRTAADEAVAAAPPAAFDHTDVLAGSARLRRRQRTTTAVALGLTTLVAGGALVYGVAIHDGRTTAALASPPVADSAPEVVDGSADSGGAQPKLAPAPPGLAVAPPEAGGDARSAPGAPGILGRDAERGGAGQDNAAPENPPGAAAPGPAAPDNSAPDNAVPSPAAPGFAESAPRAKTRSPGIVAGCFKPSTEVFERLAEVVPAVRGHTPRPVPGLCGEGGIGVAVDVPGGLLAVVLTPDGVGSPAPADTAHQASLTHPAHSGRVLRVTASSPDGPPPYLGERLRELAADLAAGL